VLFRLEWAPVGGELACETQRAWLHGRSFQFLPPYHAGSA
jgi:hypothetical protein